MAGKQIPLTGAGGKARRAKMRAKKKAKELADKLRGNDGATAAVTSSGLSSSESSSSSSSSSSSTAVTTTTASTRRPMHVSNLLFWKQSRFKAGAIIVVTGAGSGIGQHICMLYAARPGVRLVLGDISERGLAQTRAECERAGCAAANIRCVITDVTVPRQCAALIDTAVDSYGGVDVLVLCAGIGAHHVFDKGDRDDFSLYHKLMAVNFYGYLHCVRYAHPHLQRSAGQCVAITSFSGEVGLPYRTGYCASKFAITGFLEALRAEMQVLSRAAGGAAGGAGAYDITIVCPPTVNSNLRANSLTNDERLKAAADKGDAGLDVRVCAEIVVDAADRRLRKAFFPFTSWLGAYLRPLVPQFVDGAIFSKASL